MKTQATLREILGSANSLSTKDKVKLIRQVTVQIERDLKDEPTASRKSLRGLWKGLNITHQEIAEARQEMWGSFPRESI